MPFMDYNTEDDAGNAHDSSGGGAMCEIEGPSVKIAKASGVRNPTMVHRPYANLVNWKVCIMENAERRQNSLIWHGM